MTVGRLAISREHILEHPVEREVGNQVARLDRKVAVSPVAVC